MTRFSAIRQKSRYERRRSHMRRWGFMSIICSMVGMTCFLGAAVSHDYGGQFWLTLLLSVGAIAGVCAAVLSSLYALDLP